MLNTEKPVWEDKGQWILSHQHLRSELSAVRNKEKKDAVLNFTPVPQRQYYVREIWEQQCEHDLQGDLRDSRASKRI